MKEMQASLQKLRTDAAEAALIRDLAMDRRKRELFTKNDYWTITSGAPYQIIGVVYQAHF